MQFLKKFFHDPMNERFILRIIIYVVISLLLAWWIRGRPGITNNDMVELTVVLFILLAWIAPFFLLLRWNEIVKTMYREEPIEIETQFWNEPYNLRLFHNLLMFIILTSIIVFYLSGETLWYRFFFFSSHMIGLIFLIGFYFSKRSSLHAEQSPHHLHEFDGAV